MNERLFEGIIYDIVPWEASVEGATIHIQSDYCTYMEFSSHIFKESLKLGDRVEIEFIEYEGYRGVKI